MKEVEEVVHVVEVEGDGEGWGIGKQALPLRRRRGLRLVKERGA